MKAIQKALKTLLKNPIVKKFGDPELLRMGLYVLLILGPILVFLWIWWRKRRRKKLTSDNGLQLYGSALRDVWNQFRSELPSEYRDSLLANQHFIVFGSSGAGKSQVIDDGTDWEGQACQFYPSYDQTRALQVYLGSDCLVQEIPAVLLTDTSKLARKALLKLWKPLYRRHQPIAVVCLNATELEAATPDDLKRQAHLIRGKLNILSQLRGESVPVRIALTHLDERPGYQAFQSFLEEEGIPPRADLEPDGTDLANSFETFEDYLSLALTSRDAKAYREILTFLEESDRFLTPLETLVGVLKQDDPRTHSPTIQSLHLAPPKSEGEGHLFQPPETVRHKPIIRSLFTHKRIATALGIVLTLYLIGGYVYESDKVQHVEDALLALEDAERGKTDPAAVAKKIQAFDHRESNDAWQAWLPSFFDHREAEFRAIFSRTLRETLLKDLFIRSLRGKASEERSLYALALLYSSRTNELGDLVVAGLDDWAENLKLDRKTIRAYVRNTDTAWEETAWTETMLKEHLTTHGPAKSGIDSRRWFVFFHDIEQMLDRTYVTGPHLQTTKDEANELLNAASRMASFAASQQIYDTLRRETDLQMAASYGRFLSEFELPGWVEEHHRELQPFLELILASRIHVPDTTGMSLQDLVSNVKAMNDAAGTSAKAVYRFRIGKKPFAFKAADWHALILRSQKRAFLRSYLDSARKEGDSVFFPDSSSFGAITLNPTNDGTVLFTGKGRLPGRYTQVAYERQVEPVLLEMHDFIASLDVDDKTKQSFATLVQQEASRYADQYREEATRFYLSFGVEAESSASLTIVLSQMQLASSPFHDFLQAVLENTNLSFGNKKATPPLLLPLKKALSPFEPINALSLGQKGKSPELDKYRAILGQMERELEGRPPASKKAKKGKGKTGAAPSGETADDLKTFQTTLSPVGRMGFAMMMKRPGSYLHLTDQWLESVGLHGTWRKPFRAPVLEAYQLGLVDIEQTLQSNWQQRLLPLLRPILRKFPFDPKADRSVDPDELRRIVGPGGTFWTKFRRFAAPIYKFQDGRWTTRIPSLRPLQLPAEVLTLTNYFQTLSETLWDADGNPKALSLQVKPLPLPTPDSKASTQPMPVMSHLTFDGSSVFGFNQKPAFWKAACKWWASEPSSVGVQFASPGGGSTSHASRTTESVPWSLHRLLSVGEKEKGSVWAWTFETEPKGTHRIRFAFEENPWRLFDIELSKEFAGQ